MTWMRTLGLVIGSAAAWTLTLGLTRYYGGLVPFPLSLFTGVAAVGLPAFFAGPLAYRWRLWRPPVLIGAGFCLGSGAATGLLVPASETLARHLQAAVVHAATLTVLVPTTDGGYAPVMDTPLSLAIAVVIAIYGIEAYRGRGPVPGRQR